MSSCFSKHFHIIDIFIMFGTFQALRIFYFVTVNYLEVQVVIWADS